MRWALGIVLACLALAASTARAQDGVAAGSQGTGAEGTAPDGAHPAASPDASSADGRADPEDAEPVDDDDRAREDVVATLGNVVGTAGDPASPQAQPQYRIAWRADWPRYSFDEALLTLGMGALLIAAEALDTRATSANWTGGILFDQPVREGLRLRAHDARESARIASEVLMWVTIVFPFAVDALGVTGIGEGNWDAAFQMGLIAIESYVVALIVWKVVSLLARRERPVSSACADGLDTPHCNPPGHRDDSFFSNQTMNAFTGASLTCLHHGHMPLFGDEAADASTCVGAMTIAAMVGLLRVMSDFEYLTDVLMGAAVGFVAGYIIPWIAHYQGGARPELRAPVAVVPVPYIGPNDSYGLTIAGWF